MPSTDLPAFEKLGAFYLGRHIEPETGITTKQDVLYDSKDLTTHGLCVGMTGSGKTGLCIGILEEALIDGVPVIAIDPKGDLGNLLLTFPKLRPTDFEPYVDPQAALRKGHSVEEEAKAVASKWKAGLADWGQDEARIERLREAAEFRVFTPGSTTGRPLSVVSTLALPPPEVLASSEALAERIEGTVSSLLSLIGQAEDPLTSRSHALLTQVLVRSYSEGRSMDLPTLIGRILQPGIERIGVLDLETFFPAKERSQLALAFNNLLASPGFAAWLSGESLSVNSLLRGASGKPRLSVLSIAHLSEKERMFFVTLLLSEVVSWMRTQAGTTSLRALVYMDEVFGFLPPVAEPPSKRPLLTLLKQARAYGVGVVLATQNPVDVDYKALSNCGTWWLGRLQTERDKARVMEGLLGVATSAGKRLDREQLDARLSGLKGRQFVMSNVHDDGLILMQTRWVMSYLSGPLTLSQLAALDPPEPSSDPLESTQGETMEDTPPVIPAHLAASYQVARPGSEPLLYSPWLMAHAQLHFVDAKRKVDVYEDKVILAALGDKATVRIWNHSELAEEADLDLLEEAEPDARFDPLAAAALTPARIKDHPKAIVNQLYRTCRYEVMSCPSLKLHAEPGEDRATFTARAAQAARQERDLQVEKLRSKYTPKLNKLKDRIRRTEAKVGVQRSQVTTQGLNTALSIGTSLLGALFGGRGSAVSNAGRVVKGAGRVAQEKADVRRAEEDVAALVEDFEQLNAEFDGAVQELTESLGEPLIEVFEVGPRKGDLRVEGLRLLFRPYHLGARGRTRAF